MFMINTVDVHVHNDPTPTPLIYLTIFLLFPRITNSTLELCCEEKLQSFFLHNFKKSWFVIILWVFTERNESLTQTEQVYVFSWFIITRIFEVFCNFHTSTIFKFLLWTFDSFQFTDYLTLSFHTWHVQLDAFHILMFCLWTCLHKIWDLTLNYFHCGFNGLASVSTLMTW